MPEQAEEIVGSIGRELVSDLAPEELPLYPSLLREFRRGKPSGGGRKQSDDQFLGFGTGEAMTMLTPVVLAFASSVWQALVAEAAQSASHAVVEHVRSRLLGHHGAAAPPLTAGQLKLVRKVAEREAGRLGISEGQAGLLADAMMGVLAGPQA